LGGKHICHTIVLISITLRKTTISQSTASIAITPKTTSESTTMIMKTTSKIKTTLPLTIKTKTAPLTYPNTTSVR
jgi:hypothetical protein